MKYDFYNVLGVSRDADIETVTIALYTKLEELKDNKDIRLWNYLLRTANELQIQLDKQKLESKQEVSKEFWDILGVGSDTPIEELTVLLSAKYKEPEVLSDVKKWNVLHREAEKLGIKLACEEIASKGTK